MTEPTPQLVRQETVTRSELRKRNPVSNGHDAVVYLTKRGEYLLANSRLTAAEIILDTPREMYVVDVSPHRDTVELSLPSREEAFAFAASINVTWRVASPIGAVLGRKTSADGIIRQFLEEELRDVTRQFQAEHSADAEREIKRCYGDREIKVNDYLVVTRCVGKLSMDDGTHTHVAERTLVERTKIHNAQQHKIDLQRAEYEREMEDLRQTHKLQLKTARMRIYAQALRDDDLNLIALRLAGTGEDVNDVINLVMQQRKLEFEGASSLLNSLLEANLVNRKDVEAIMAKASSAVVNHLRGVTPVGIGSADTPGGAPQLSGQPQPSPAPRPSPTTTSVDDDEDEED